MGTYKLEHLLNMVMWKIWTGLDCLLLARGDMIYIYKVVHPRFRARSSERILALHQSLQHYAIIIGQSQ